MGVSKLFLFSRFFTCILFWTMCLFGCESKPEEMSGEKKEQIREKNQTLSSIAKKKKVLFINSYHSGYEWSDRIGIEIFRFFNIPVEDIVRQGAGVGDVHLRIVYMDSKRQKTEEYLIRKGLEIKVLIEQWLPDVVITSDDNAAKYVISPYFRDHTIPFVFCGINWDASDYSLPALNVTGMLEVQLIDEILKNLKNLAAGPRVGFLKGDDMSARKEATFYEERFGITLDKRFVSTFDQWQEEYLALQQQADMLLLGNTTSVKDWKSADAKKLVNENSLIPSGNWDLWMAPYALMTFATKPEEQGAWAAKKAQEIMHGKNPSSIGVVQNKVANVILNMQLANRMGVKFPMGLVENAHLLDQGQ